MLLCGSKGMHVCFGVFSTPIVIFGSHGCKDTVSFIIILSLVSFSQELR